MYDKFEPVMKHLSLRVGDLTKGDLTPPGSDEGQACVPHPLLWASPPQCHSALCPATPGISHSQPATTGRPLDSPPTRPSPSAVQDQDHLQQLCRRQDQDHRQLPCLKTKESREGRRREKLPCQHSFLCCLSFPKGEEERRNCNVSTASCCCTVSGLLQCCLSLQLLPRASAAYSCIHACIVP